MQVFALFEILKIERFHFKQTIMKKSIYFCLSTLVLTIASLSSCSSDDVSTSSPTSLYAIVKPEGAQLIDIIPSDYVMTLDNIIAVNPETGEFKMKNTERIDSKAYPIPTQYVIQFYSEHEFLFEAKLNSTISSYLPTGLTFCHFLTDKNGLARYDLSVTNFIGQDGKIEGELTTQQEQGMQRMYQILQKAGKTSNHISYDFKY